MKNPKAKTTGMVGRWGFSSSYGSLGVVGRLEEPGDLKSLPASVLSPQTLFLGAHDLCLTRFQALWSQVRHAVDNVPYIFEHVLQRQVVVVSL